MSCGKGKDCGLKRPKGSIKNLEYLVFCKRFDTGVSQKLSGLVFLRFFMSFS
jgi:hypothetical protein